MCHIFSIGKRQLFQQMLLGKLDGHMQKNELDSYSIYKNEVNTNQRHKRAKATKLRSHRGKSIQYWIRQWFLKYAAKVIVEKKKKKQTN